MKFIQNASQSVQSTIGFSFGCENSSSNKDIIDNNYNNESYKLVKLSVLVKNSNYSKKEIFIIGGEKIYNTYLDLMNTMNYFDLQMKYIYLTYINKNYK